MTDHLVFLTGKLAKISLEKVLSDISSKNKFTYDVIDIGVNVAALATIKNCCETCEGKTVDNCVTYVYGGQCEPTVVPAYVRCEYVD